MLAVLEVTGNNILNRKPMHQKQAPAYRAFPKIHAIHASMTQQSAVPWYFLECFKSICTPEELITEERCGLIFRLKKYTGMALPSFLRFGKDVHSETIAAPIYVDYRSQEGTTVAICTRDRDNLRRDVLQTAVAASSQSVRKNSTSSPTEHDYLRVSQ